ncbi:thioesterase domain-containing protein [Pseudoalteromonas luteoviolacea]|uniref:Thioesterase domain-containing protein n=1 Tax=Pseudoalteromonas luteoviolacea S4054 TaxID=1129367 RepID=A0A0F6A6I9_9GAMM|nr:thioesterase domain-containing protein [Pseudoalteromonas luteoviolacea]AOT10869.1 hypothetical protein S4054249_23780 [Pseudoalteromonas luteoviolacea]AOT15969.1 hypothetical protein S40542_24730 [Pseudoalteromonas luteoviolacea]AOT20690.1 hypothetical protein S4054_23700 [Pseudoalteromonas luteoviolacea]KKE81790.1 hypothetical protein N479_02180 [Pseudoalteromonas luteoviolacea S4054]KZN66252.1 hypothetical protein N481_24900 [Pseudoalteromonas luteoviolacea S4047-1]
MVDLSRYPTIVELNESSSSKLIFCTHPAGGGLNAYKDMANKLPHKVLGLEDPSIYDDQVFDSIPDLAEYHVETIRAIQPQGPYYVFGQCSGGPLAYEIAYQLTLEGEQVEVLAMFGAHQLLGFDPSEKSNYGFLPEYLHNRFSIDLSQLNWVEMESLTIEAVVDKIVEELCSQKVLDSSKDIEWVKRSIRSLCLSRNASKKYIAPTSGLNIQHYKQPREAQSVKAFSLNSKDWCDWESLTHGELIEIAHSDQMTITDSVLRAPFLSETMAKLEQHSLSRIA